MSLGSNWAQLEYCESVSVASVRAPITNDYNKISECGV